MKIILCLLTIIGFEAAFAQSQSYTFSDDSFTFLVRVYSDIAIGEEAFGINTYYTPDGAAPDVETAIDLEVDSPSEITDYEHAGLDANGTLHLLKEDTRYVRGSFATDSQESYEVSVDISEPLTFEGNLRSPDVELSIQAIEGGKLNITLVNADAFEVFTE